VSLAVSDFAEPHRFFEVRGEVVERRTEGAADHIEELAQRYTGEPYPWFGGRDQERVILVIEPHNVSTSS
jgi:hypothetical protein